MSHRIAAWSLAFAFASQLLNLWPFPGDVAAERIALYSKWKAEWEASDSAKSENPDWAARARTESLARINKVLADPDSVLEQARFEWSLWASSATVAAAAAFAAAIGSGHWRWLTLVSVGLFLFLQQPWRLFDVFRFQGEFDLARGIRQLQFIGSDYPGTLAAMLIVNIAVTLVMLVVAACALLQIMRRRPHAL
jgi:hypothetical protein